MTRIYRVTYQTAHRQYNHVWNTFPDVQEAIADAAALLNVPTVHSVEVLNTTKGTTEYRNEKPL